MGKLTAEMMLDYPILWAARVGRQLVGDCPICGFTHRHGAVGPAFGDGDGHRGAHCLDTTLPGYSNGYVVVEKPQEFSKGEKKYREKKPSLRQRLKILKRV